MPRNKREGLLFTTLMCFLMVIGMSAYNLALHNALSIHNLAHGLVPGFFVAFILDTFIVGVMAKKVAFKLPLVVSKQIYLILTISSLMIIGMVTCMSLFGLLVQGTELTSLAALYPHAWLMNLIAALPYQLLIVGPVSRSILAYVQSRSAKNIAD